MPSTGYAALLRSNAPFRNLWIAEVISFLGDWFNTIALYTAIAELSGDTEAIAGVFVAKTLPVFLMTPFAGPLVDRFDRRKIMIVTDVARALCVVGLIAAYRLHSMELLFGSLVVMVAFAGIFIPARTSVLPQLTSITELAAANALSAATWSVMLALGAASGGLVTELLGIELALVCDGATFLVSALFLLRLPPLLPTADDPAADDPAADDRAADDPATDDPVAAEPVADEGSGAATASPNDTRFLAGLAYLRRHPYLAVVVSLKGMLGLSVGAVALLPKFAASVGDGGATAIGTLYTARGLGALTGSLLVRKIFGDAPKTMQRLIVPAIVVVGAGYIGLSFSDSLTTMAVAYFTSAVGGGTVWVFAGTLSQLASDNRFRGRVFGLEWGALTLSMSTMAWLAGAAVDRLAWPLQRIALVSGSLMVVPLLVWLATLAGRAGKRDGDAAVSAGSSET